MKKHEYAIELLRFMKKEIKETHIGWMGEEEAKKNRKQLSLAIKALKMTPVDIILPIKFYEYKMLKKQKDEILIEDIIRSANSS